MILNPWKSKWKMPVKEDELFRMCPYSRLYKLPCGAARHRKKLDRTLDQVGPDPRRDCEDCFFRQEGLSQAGLAQSKIKVDRVCDRCGTKIEDVDRLLYVIVRDRKGNYICDKELCLECNQEVMDWINGKDFPKNQVDESPFEDTVIEQDEE